MTAAQITAVDRGPWQVLAVDQLCITENLMAFIISTLLSHQLIFWVTVLADMLML